MWVECDTPTRPGDVTRTHNVLMTAQPARQLTVCFAPGEGAIALHNGSAYLLLTVRIPRLS